MKKRILQYCGAAIIWFLIWHAAAAAVNEPLLLPSPVQTMLALLRLGSTGEFWNICLTTFMRVAGGILAAALIGCIGGTLCGFFPALRILFSPILSTIKSAPVASFIVLLVLWLKRDAVPGIISALVVIPVFWSSLQEGIPSVDRSLLEMARSYRIGICRTVRGIYLPSLQPYLFSAAASSFGMGWKAGVAAEIITLPGISIGRRVYIASNNLQTDEVFAWTAAVILLSLTADCAVSRLFRSKSDSRRIHR